MSNFSCDYPSNCDTSQLAFKLHESFQSCDYPSNCDTSQPYICNNKIQQ
ncbi:hypothetical protein EMIT036CA2_40198 [Chryseobacterium sp. IT-36CA2]